MITQLWIFLFILYTPLHAGLSNLGSKDFPIKDAIEERDLDQTAASNTAMYTISKSGRYQLASDIVLNPENNNTYAIQITSSNVILDFDTHTISQLPTSNNSITIIDIASGVANVTIECATLSDSRGIGIKINPNVTNITIRDTTVDKCTHIGIDIDSAESVWLERVYTARCDGSHEYATDGAVGIKINNATNVTLKEVTVVANNNNSGNSSGILVKNSTGCLFNETIASHNQGFNAYGFVLTGACISCQLISCTAINNSSSAGDAIGFSIEYSQAIKLVGCQSESNSSTNGNAIGFFLNNTHNCTVNACDAQSNKANKGNTFGYYVTSNDGTNFNNCKSVRNTVLSNNTCYGFFFTGCLYNKIVECLAQSNNTITGAGDVYGYCSSGGTGNVFDRCTAVGNRSTTTDALGCGFALTNNEQRAAIINCITENNSSAAGTGYGIVLASPQGAVSNCTIKNNIMSNNWGIHAYGFKDFTPVSTTLFTNNIAYGQGKSLRGTALNDSGSNNYWLAVGASGNATKIITEVAITDFSNLTGSAAHNVSLY